MESQSSSSLANFPDEPNGQTDMVSRQSVSCGHRMMFPIPHVEARYVDLTSPNRHDPHIYVKIPFSVYTKVLKHMEYMKHKDPGKNVVKGGWSKEEDDKLLELVHLMGAKGWNQIAQHLPGRLGKQCRERYVNHLDPTVCKDKWSADEDEVIIQAYRTYGAQWSKISKLLPRARTANATKNHWNSSLKRVFIEMMEGNENEDENETEAQPKRYRGQILSNFSVMNPHGMNAMPNSFSSPTQLHGNPFPSAFMPSSALPAWLHPSYAPPQTFQHSRSVDYGRMPVPQSSRGFPIIMGSSSDNDVKTEAQFLHEHASDIQENSRTR